MWWVVRMVLMFGSAAFVIVVFADTPLGGLVTLAFVTVPILLATLIAAGVAIILSQKPDWAGKFAAWGSLVVCGTVGLVAALSANGSGPSCDAFCMSQTEARIYAMVWSVVVGGGVALLSGPLAAYFVAWTRRRYPLQT